MDAMRELVLALAGAEKKSKRIFHKWWKVKDEAIRLREQIVQLATQIANDPGDEHQEPDLGGEGLKCTVEHFKVEEFTIPHKLPGQVTSASIQKIIDEYGMVEDTPTHAAAQAIANDVAKDEPRRINFREFL